MIRTVILAGGAGTRFWPISREQQPKQLLKMFSNKTLLEETIDRAKGFSDTIAISTGKVIEQQIENLKTGCELIVEPCRRDTAAAIGLCATKYDLDDTIIFLPSDAYIKEIDKFEETIKKTIEIVDDSITVIGIKPDKPATCYGYLKVENESVINFKEKPDLETAKKYVEDGYLWNAGIFIVKVKTLLNLFQQLEPQIYEKLIEIKKTGKISEIYPTIKKTSFDYAIMEKAKQIKFVEAEFYWNDIGSFDALPEIIDGENTVLEGKLKQINSTKNIIRSNKTIALIDCEELIVIDTEDALLVCPKKSVEKIKQMVSILGDELK